jgi:hypothetical protein
MIAFHYTGSKSLAKTFSKDHILAANDKISQVLSRAIPDRGFPALYITLEWHSRVDWYTGVF